MKPIRFGTSGWRGVIAREFTFERVERVLDAIATQLSAEQHMRGDGAAPGPVCIGGDTRFLSPELAEMAARRMSAHGFTALLSDRPVPTPVLSHAVRELKGLAVINFTASHNPALYNGIKFSPHHGGPASRSVTDAIESFIGSSEGNAPAACDSEPGKLPEYDFVSVYLEQLARIVSWETIRENPLRVVYDPFYGTGRGILDEELRRRGASAVRTIHDRRDPLFGNRRPEPCEQELEELSREVVRSGASLGVSTDGDADRFGIIDEDGVFVSPHDYLPLLLDYLVTERGWSKGIVVRSLSTGSLLDRVARSHGLEVEETRVGFKYLGELMIEKDVILAGEESGGLSVLGHVPEKDGIAACLLAAEMVSRRGMGIGAQLREHLWPRFGRLVHRRRDVELTDGIRSALSSRYLEDTPGSVAGLEVISVDRRDGAKFHLEREDNWFLVRLSGTEPLARLFFQSDSPEGLDTLSEGVLSLLPQAH